MTQEKLDIACFGIKDERFILFATPKAKTQAVQLILSSEQWEQLRKALNTGEGQA
jgi:hypothetical protein